MFAYCANTPVMYADTSGYAFFPCTICFDSDGRGGKAYPDSEPREELAVLSAEGITLYNGVPVIRLPFGGNVGFSAGVIFLGNGVEANDKGVATLRHEYGHAVHLSQIGWESYIVWVLIPSVVNFYRGVEYSVNYSQPWEYIADMLGSVNRANYVYATDAQEKANEYYQFTFDYVGVYPNE